MIYNNIKIVNELLNKLLNKSYIHHFKYSGLSFNLYFTKDSEELIIDNYVIFNKIILYLENLKVKISTNELNLKNTISEEKDDDFISAYILTKLIQSKVKVSSIKIENKVTIIIFENETTICISNFDRYEPSWILCDIQTFETFYSNLKPNIIISCENNHFYVNTPIKNINGEYLNE